MPSIPANQPVTAIFARNYAAAASALLPKPYVAVIPHDSSWNDFGRYYGVRLLAFQSDSTTLEFEMHLMFEGAPYTKTSTQSKWRSNFTFR